MTKEEAINECIKQWKNNIKILKKYIGHKYDYNQYNECISIYNSNIEIQNRSHKIYFGGDCCPLCQYSLNKQKNKKERICINCPGYIKNKYRCDKMTITNPDEKETSLLCGPWLSFKYKILGNSTIDKETIEKAKNMLAWIKNSKKGE